MTMPLPVKGELWKTIQPITIYKDKELPLGAINMKVNIPFLVLMCFVKNKTIYFKVLLGDEFYYFEMNDYTLPRHIIKIL